MHIKGRELLDPTKQLRFVNLAVPFVRVADLDKAQERPEDMPVYMKVNLRFDEQATQGGCWTVVDLTTGWVTWMPGAELVLVIEASLVVGD